MAIRVPDANAAIVYTSADATVNVAQGVVTVIYSRQPPVTPVFIPQGAIISIQRIVEIVVQLEPPNVISLAGTCGCVPLPFFTNKT